MVSRTRPRLRHLHTRIIIFFVVLLTLVQGAAFLLVNAANSRNAQGTGTVDA